MEGWLTPAKALQICQAREQTDPGRLDLPHAPGGELDFLALAPSHQELRDERARARADERVLKHRKGVQRGQNPCTKNSAGGDCCYDQIGHG